MAIGVVFGNLHSTVLFFTHLYGLGLYALVVAGYELWRWRETRSGEGGLGIKRLVAAAAQFPAPLGLFAAAAPTLPGSAWELGSWSVWAKVGGLYGVFNSGNPSQDAAFFLLLALSFGVVAPMGRICIAAGMRLPMILLGGCFLAMPGLLFGSGYADYRLPYAALLFLIAATAWTPTRPGSRRALLVAFVVLLAGRAALVSRAWADTRVEYEDAERAIAVIPEGSRVFGYVITGEPRFGDRPPLDHLITLAVIRKSAFVPSLFAFPGKHPVRLRREYQAIAERTPHPTVVNQGIAEASDSASHPLGLPVGRLYDYLVLFARDPKGLDLPGFYRDTFSKKHVRLLEVTDPSDLRGPETSAP